MFGFLGNETECPTPSVEGQSGPIRLGRDL